jgi:hypothetical protein
MIRLTLQAAAASCLNPVNLINRKALHNQQEYACCHNLSVISNRSRRRGLALRGNRLSSLSFIGSFIIEKKKFCIYIMLNSEERKELVIEAMPFASGGLQQFHWYSFSNEMIIHFDVLRSSMQDWIRG